MGGYRCYFLKDGHICATEELKCDNDMQARTAALLLLTRHQQFHGVEVWDQRRMIYAYSENTRRAV